MYDISKPVKLIKQCIYNRLKYVLVCINFRIITPFTWEHFKQSSLTDSWHGFSPRKIGGVLMNHAGMCYGLCAFYALHIQNPDGQSFIKSLEAKMKAPELHTAYFEKLLFTHLTPDKREYKNIQELQDNTISSLLQNVGLQHSTTIGITISNSGGAGHEIAFTIASGADEQIEYELFDPNFGIFKTSNEYLLKAKILELAIYYGYEKIAFNKFESLATEEVNWNLTENNRNTPLTAACLRENIAMVKFLLEEKGANIDLPDGNGYTALTMAVSKGNVAMVKLLLEKGANIDLPDGNGWTPVASAAIKGHVAVLKLLVEKGAKIDLPNPNGHTPLTTAVLNGNVAMVRLLLEKGAKIDLQNTNGYTPLTTAASNGNVAMVKLLLEKGANATMQDGKGYTPMAIASVNKHTSTVELLQQALQPNPWVERFAQSIEYCLMSAM